MLPFGVKLYKMFENIINNLYYCIQTISCREKKVWEIIMMSTLLDNYNIYNFKLFFKEIMKTCNCSE